MIAIGWIKGKEHVLHTDSPVKLTRFAEVMERVEYVQIDEKGVNHG